MVLLSHKKMRLANSWVPPIVTFRKTRTLRSLSIVPQKLWSNWYWIYRQSQSFALIELQNWTVSNSFWFEVENFVSCWWSDMSGGNVVETMHSSFWSTFRYIQFWTPLRSFLRQWHCFFVLFCMFFGGLLNPKKILWRQSFFKTTSLPQKALSDLKKTKRKSDEEMHCLYDFATWHVRSSKSYKGFNF